MSYAQWVWFAYALHQKEKQQAEQAASVRTRILEIVRDMAIGLLGLGAGARAASVEAWYSREVQAIQEDRLLSKGDRAKHLKRVEELKEQKIRELAERTPDDLPPFTPLTMWLLGPEFVADQYKAQQAYEITQGRSGKELDDVADAIFAATQTSQFKEFNKKVWDTPESSYTGPVAGSKEFDDMLRRLGVELASEGVGPAVEPGWGTSGLSVAAQVPKPPLSSLEVPEEEEGTFFRVKEPRVKEPRGDTAQLEPRVEEPEVPTVSVPGTILSAKAQIKRKPR